jgi:hypothetical protein
MPEKDYSAAITVALKVVEGVPEQFQGDAFRIILQDLVTTAGASDMASAGSARTEAASPAEFIRQKRPEGGTVKLAALAYYLDRFSNKSDFALRDINQVARLAKLKDLHPQYLVEAVKQGFITSSSVRGTYRLTLSGEAKVEALGR